MKLEKKLKFIDVFCIASGAMISSGIFILPGIAYEKAGPSVIFSYFLGGVLAFLGILSIIELSTAMPKAGGDYFFINRSLGPLAGTISGILSWFALSLKSAFAIYGLSELLRINFNINPIFSYISFAIVFIILNIVGVELASKFENIIVISLLVILGFFIFSGTTSLNTENYLPFFRTGINSSISTASFIFVSFGGLINVASISEEVIAPKKNISQGIIASIVLVTILYTAILFITVGTLGGAMSGNLTPLADSAYIIFGNKGYIMMSIGAVLAFLSTANAGIMAASRYPLALAKDNLIPTSISKVSHRFKTPSTSILVTGAFIISAGFLKLEVLVKMASSVILLTYILTNISVIILRESKLETYRPSFKTKFYPFLQIISVAIYIILIVDMGIASVEIAFFFLALTLGVYFFYGRKKYSGQFAIGLILERIIDKKVANRHLEKELREIVLNRDEIELDRFDDLVLNSTVFDFDKTLNLDEVFKICISELHKEYSVNTESVKKEFFSRKGIEHTAINEFLAIPHIVVNEDILKLFIVRNKSGVRFSEKADSIKCMFILIGTKNDKKFHLQTLAAIAKISLEKGFEENWLRIKSESIKEFIILSERKRF